jgi:uncharacterized phage-associated protein
MQRLGDEQAVERIAMMRWQVPNARGGPAAGRLNLPVRICENLGRSSEKGGWLSMIRFPFNEAKAAQAAAFLLVHNGGRLSYMKLIKLLYLADRRALVSEGNPITGSGMALLRFGPILTDVYDLISWGSRAELSPWLELISEPQGYDVRLLKQPADYEELSERELEILRWTLENFNAYDQWQLSRLTHELPEWQDPGRSSLPIDPADILRFENVAPEEIAEISRISHELRVLAG